MFPTAPERRPDESDELLSFVQIHQEGGPAVQTQYIWASTGRYGYDKLVIKIGRLSRIPRSRYRAWLAERSVHNAAAE